MTTFQLDDDLAQLLRQVARQLSQQLPPLTEPTDFAAPAFVWDGRQLQAVTQLQPVGLNDLQGIDRQKKQLVQNTEQFLQGLPANNVLLTGSRGAGKSSLVRALLNDYRTQGLRLIEVGRDHLVDLPRIRQLIAGRPEKFIVYCDDLAFNAEDEQYRSLKSALDGSLQSDSDNMLIYATSNRRHLLPEFMQDNTPARVVDVPQYGELHPQEAIEEKISLSDRFGLWLSFHPMDQQVYLQVVAHWLAQAGISLDETAQTEALKWAHTRGQRSGRSAQQFARHWIGQQKLQQIKADHNG